MFSLRVLPRSITLLRFGSPRGFVFRDLSIRSIGSITRVGSEDSFMMKINNARGHAHRLGAEQQVEEQIVLKVLEQKAQ